MLFFNGKKSKAILDVVGDVGTLGTHMVASTFVGLAIGYFLDKWLGTKPWLLLLFLLVGIVAGFKNMYEQAMRILARENKRHDAPDQGQSKD